MRQLLVYGDSLSWGIVPDTRQRLPFAARWPGVLEGGLRDDGLDVRVIEDCLNGRRTVWDDPYKPGRNGLDGLEQRIEINAPLALVVVMLGTNDFQSMHQHDPEQSAQGLAARRARHPARADRAGHAGAVDPRRRAARAADAAWRDRVEVPRRRGTRGRARGGVRPHGGRRGLRVLRRRPRDRVEHRRRRAPRRRPARDPRARARPGGDGAPVTLPDVTSERLVLRSMTPAFLSASGRGIRQIDGLLGLTVADGWFDERALARQRLADLGHDPRYAPWSLRAIGLRATDQMIGHIGFHTRPGPGYLGAIAPSGVELGYTVYAPFRRRGYAREAIVAMMAWARAQGVPRFVVSVAPGNVASQALAASLGFVRVGGHMDETDGYEDILLLEGSALAACLRRATPRADTADARRTR